MEVRGLVAEAHWQEQLSADSCGICCSTNRVHRNAREVCPFGVCFEQDESSITRYWLRLRIRITATEVLLHLVVQRDPLAFSWPEYTSTGEFSEADYRRLQVCGRCRSEDHRASGVLHEVRVNLEVEVAAH